MWGGHIGRECFPDHSTKILSIMESKRQLLKSHETRPGTNSNTLPWKWMVGRLGFIMETLPQTKSKTPPKNGHPSPKRKFLFETIGFSELHGVSCVDGESLWVAQRQTNKKGHAFSVSTAFFFFFRGGGGNVQGSKIFEYIWKTGWPPNKHEAHISQRVSCGPLIIAARTSTRARNATACRWGCWWVWSARATFQNLNSKVWSTRTTKKEFLQTLCNSLPSHCKIAMEK